MSMTDHEEQFRKEGVNNMNESESSFETYYRYDSYNGVRKYSLFLSELVVVGHTKKGVYVAEGIHESYERRYIAHDWRKKYAYPTKEEAAYGFIRRKQREIAILESRLRCAKACLQIAESDDITQSVSKQPLERWGL